MIGHSFPFSLMDHTPGQRQYLDVAKYREYYSSEGWNDSVRQVLNAGALDLLSSDYAPYSLLPAIFRLHAQGMPLPEAVAMVSATPASCVGLADTGRLEPGARGDVLRVRLQQGPIVLAAWRAGEAVVAQPGCANVSHFKE